jgi:hypothetical protein
MIRFVFRDILSGCSRVDCRGPEWTRGNQSGGYAAVLVRDAGALDWMIDIGEDRKTEKHSVVHRCWQPEGRDLRGLLHIWLLLEQLAGDIHGKQDPSRGPGIQEEL